MDAELKDLLMVQARVKGMCLTNYRPLLYAETVGELIALYKRTIDWALENQYPSYDVIKDYFSNCGHLGVYVDKKFKGQTLKDHDVYVFHKCRGTINVELNIKERTIPMLYFANGCEMKIVCKQENPIPIHVPLYIFGINDINAKDTKNAVFSRFKMDLI